MKITGFSLYHVPMRFLYLKIETDEGISGWGEPLVEGRADTLAAAVKEWEGYFVGQDPLLVEKHWQNMYRGAFYRGGPVMMSAMAGIDQALWDIRGKYFGVPVYRLLNGGVKKRVKVYRSIHGDSVEELVRDARRAKEQGYKLIKMSPNSATHYLDDYRLVEGIVEKVETVRKALGPEIGVAIDLHGRIHRPMAKVFAQALDPLRLSFIEEPVLPNNYEAFRTIAQYTATPIATGERMYSRWDFKTLLEEHSVDILQPDLSHAGGISECMRIAAMGEAYDLALAPHCPLSVIAFASCIHVDGAANNAVFQEQSIDIHDCTRQNEKLRWIKNPEAFAFEDGFVRLPEGPGLGIEVDEAAVEEAGRHPHNWKNPMWETYDGSTIEW